MSIRPARWLGALALAAISYTATATAAEPQLTIAFDDARVTAGGANSGAKVIVVGYERRIQDRVQAVKRHHSVLTADAGGNAVMKPDGGVSPHSVWVAVDVATGRFGTAAPGGGSGQQIALRPESLKKDNLGQLRKFVSRLPRTYLLLVRPGAGAWDLMAGDGGRSDDDLVIDGKIEVSTESMKPMRGYGEAPKNFRKGDLIVGFSPDQLAYFVVRIEN